MTSRKRQSTTAKMTQSVVKMIHEYTTLTGGGVMVRLGGVEFGVSSVQWFSDDDGYTYPRFATHEGYLIPPKCTTIPKATIQFFTTLQGGILSLPR